MMEARGAFRLFMDADNSTTIDQMPPSGPGLNRDTMS